MSSLSSPHILCPLSERKELLGLSGDKHVDKVILTISKNIAIRYQVQEQQQETSWTSSRHWFTSPVIYCPELDRYGAVLDNNVVALWAEDDAALDHVLKIKFSDPILFLHSLPQGKGTLVVFENGFVTPLTNVTTGDKKRVKGIAKDNGFLDPATTTIIDICQSSENPENLVILSGDKAEGRGVVKRRVLNVTLLTEEGKVGSTLELRDKNIVGCTLSSSSLIYLDGDEGKLWSQPLTSSPPSLLGTVGKVVSVKNAVVLKIASPSSLLLYGSNPGEEGAVVALYDMTYDLVVASQGLKLYSNPPIMELVGGRNVLIPMGLHILVLSYRGDRGVASKLSSMVGKHGLKAGEEVFEGRDPFASAFVPWGDKVKGSRGRPKGKGPEQKKEAYLKKKYPAFHELVSQFKILEKEGQPSALIAEQLMGLGALQREGALEWMLDNVELNEAHVVASLEHLIKNSPANKDELIRRLLSSPFDAPSLTKALRTLDFDIVKRLTSLLQELMAEGDLQGLEEGVAWLDAICDAHYTHFVLNEEVELINQLVGAMTKGEELMGEISQLEPHLLLLVNKVDITPRPNPNAKWTSQVINFL